VRPAFYALRRGGWRDYVTLLHAPYTAWHLSYVVVGGCLVAEVSWGRLGLTVLAFFLAMGIGAHALDELAGRPLQTAIPGPVLVALAVASVVAACVIGLAVAIGFSLWILPLIAIGAFLVPAYNLELFGGRFHSNVWFALAWGAFPVVTGAVAVAGTVRAATVIAAVWATVLSLAQRRLSTPVRRNRREVVSATGELELAGGAREPITQEALVEAPEAALKLLAAATILIAAALVAFRL
jgi:hypothetical protein